MLLLTPCTSCKAVFVDTDRVPAFDSRVGDLVQNEVEAKVVYQITEALLRCGISQNQIGIMSLYQQQIKLLSHLLQNRGEIEILTADKSQGRDKDCVIMSMVRSNNTGYVCAMGHRLISSEFMIEKVGNLLKDWRRVNVSFTRAQSKLIIIGSRNTLQTSPLLAEFLALMDERKWVLTLPGGAQDVHPSLDPPQKVTRCHTSKRTKENENSPEGPTPPKKPRSHNARDGVLKGRPILRDVLCFD